VSAMWVERVESAALALSVESPAGWEESPEEEAWAFLLVAPAKKRLMVRNK
jgi:hypothetical protein